MCHKAYRAPCQATDLCSHANRSETVSYRDCGKCEEINVIHRTDMGTPPPPPQSKCLVTLLRHGPWHLTPGVPLGGGDGGMRGFRRLHREILEGGGGLCTKNDLTKLSQRQISVFPTMVTLVLGGGGPLPRWCTFLPLPPVVLEFWRARPAQKCVQPRTSSSRPAVHKSGAVWRGLGRPFCENL